VLPLGLLLLAGVGCSSTQSLQSAPMSAPITLDGSDEDWAGALQPVADQPGLGVGVRNDGEALYVVAVLRNEAQVRQAVRSGLTLWLDPAGGTDRALGVRFPLGMSPGGPADGGRDGQGRGEDLSGRLATLAGDLEVLQDGAEAGSRRPANGASSIQASATLQGSVLVVEYRVLLADGPFALGALPGTSIGLGLTTSEVERPDEAARGGRGGRQGGGGGRGAGGRGGGGQRPDGGGRQGERPTPLDVWLGVALSVDREP